MEKGQMTDQELFNAARNYDNIQNESGEGYNPYTSEIERREYEAATSRPMTKQDKIDALHDTIRIECGSVARECGDNTEIDAKQDKIYKEIDSLKAEITADFVTAWPIDLTKSRRVEWNDFIKKTVGTGKVTPDGMRLIYKKQGDQGWMLDALKKALKIHNL